MADQEPDRWLGLLRGVNVGGKNKLPMADLRSALSTAGFERVATYIQSGNILFSAPPKGGGAGRLPKPAEVGAQIGELLADRFGLSVPCVVLSSERLQSIVTANPFPEMESQPKALHVYFTQDSVADLGELDASRYEPDRAVVAGGTVYAAYPDGMARSKLTSAVIDRATGQPSTARNWNTVLKLLALAHETNEGS